MTREEAIKILKENYCAICAYGSPNTDSCDISSCDTKDAIKALEQEPTWTSVKDKLPEDDLDVLVLFENGITMAVAYHRTDETPWEDRRVANASGWYDENDEWICSTQNIFAWMLLPEPYKEVDE